MIALTDPSVVGSVLNKSLGGDSSPAAAKDSTPVSTHSAPVERKSFSIVNLNQTSIAPKESVTYEKQTQTIGHNTERGGIDCLLVLNVVLNSNTFFRNLFN